LTAELDFGGKADRWMDDLRMDGIKPDLSDCLAQSKNRPFLFFFYLQPI
jgi:hypothetical protein